MANIYLTDEAYARLKAAKKDGQSFSAWVTQNVKPDVDWQQFVGSCKDLDIKKAMAELKKERRRYL